MNNFAALYMRLSKEDGKSESRSISSQREILKNYAAEKGFLIFDEYIDDGFSGTNFERPAFKRMLSDIENGKIGIIITKDLSRLGRDYISAGQFTEIYFPSKGVRYIAVNDGYDSENGFSDLAPFKNLINEMYARDTSRKIRSAFSARMRKGDFVGAFAPFGYKRSSENRHKLVLDEKASQIVKFIFLNSAEGKRPIEIARKLDSDNVPTPLDFRKGIPKSGNWSIATILKILHNPIYLGDMVQGKTSKISFKTKTSINLPEENWVVVHGTHEAIIDRETFEKVNRK